LKRDNKFFEALRAPACRLPDRQAGEVAFREEKFHYRTQNLIAEYKLIAERLIYYCQNIFFFGY
jgi:hypothetical protein